MEASKERTLAKCSCCQGICTIEGIPLTLDEWRVVADYNSQLLFLLSVCTNCIDEADDQGITVEQLRERNNEHNVETEAY